MPYKIRLNGRYGFREDTLENWRAENPVLEKGEPSIVRDPAEPSEWLKIGDGITPWNDLSYKTGPKGDKGDKGDTGAIEFKVVQELPEVGNENIMYLVSNTTAQDQNAYDEYIFTNNAWEKIGTASVSVDLTNYVKKDYVATYSTAGLVKPDSWTGIVLSDANTGKISLVDCVKAHIDNKGLGSQRVAITTKMLDYAIKVGMTTNQEVWTEDEKQAARDLIGVTELVGDLETLLGGI